MTADVSSSLRRFYAAGRTPGVLSPFQRYIMCVGQELRSSNVKDGLVRLGVQRARKGGTLIRNDLFDQMHQSVKYRRPSVSS